MMKVGLIFILGIVIVKGKCTGPKEKDVKSGNESWGYVDVRPNAHMFWWLYRSTHPDGYANRPLILWLQGGPGGSSSGYGNFEIIGPLDLQLKPRESTWVQEANMLFVDNPVGAGFSYVDTDDAFTTDNEEIATDLLTLMKEFLGANADFKTSEFYIFGQSYGGKMAANFARRLHESIQAGEIDCNLKGFAMGNAWIHPVDSTTTWGNFLYEMSTVDETGRDKINEAADRCKDAADNDRWTEATNLWRETKYVLNEYSNNVNYYNILKFRVYRKNAKNSENGNDTTYQESYDEWENIHPSSSPWNKLYDLMNGPIREKLGIIPEHIQFGAQYDPVFKKQEGDFMKPVVDIVGEMLDLGLTAIVYQGQLDLICDTTGAMQWVQRLQWDKLEDYNDAKRVALTDPDTKQTELFVKAHQNFKFYWVLRAGHAVPKDQGPAARRMLQRILADLDK